MTTKFLASNVLRFSKFITVATVMAIGYGLAAAPVAAGVPASSGHVLSEQQADGAAKIILATPTALRYNAAVNLIKELTANTGAAYTVINAKLLAKEIPESQQLALLPAILAGITYNYPNQYAAVAMQLILLDEKTREHSEILLARISSLLDSSTADQMAVALNVAIREHNEIRGKAGALSLIILSNISNSSTGTAAQRANEMAIAAGNLAAGLLDPNKCGDVSKANIKAYNQIANMLMAFAKTIPTGTLTRDELLYNVVGNFTTTIKASLPAGTSAATIAAIAARTRQIVLQQVPASADTVNKAIQDVVNNPTDTFQNTGNVNPPETPH